MGQRIIIVAEIKTPEKTVRVAYHKQWGIGSRGARACIALLTTDFFRPQFGTEPINEEYMKRLDNPSAPSLTPYFTNEELQKYLTKENEVYMAEVIKNHDNNNGGIYLQLEFNKFCGLKKGKVRFYKGDEECYALGESDKDIGKQIKMAEYFTLHKSADEIAPILAMFNYEGVEVE